MEVPGLMREKRAILWGDTGQCVQQELRENVWNSILRMLDQAGNNIKADKGERRVYTGALLSNPGISTVESPQGDNVDAVFEDGC